MTAQERTVSWPPTEPRFRYKVQQDGGTGRCFLKQCDDGDLIDYGEHKLVTSALREQLAAVRKAADAMDGVLALAVNIHTEPAGPEHDWRWVISGRKALAAYRVTQHITGVQAMNMEKHSTEEDFQHFLSYSNLRGSAFENELRTAFYAGADVPLLAATQAGEGESRG